MESELKLNVGGLPPFSARGCQQELVPVATGQFYRSVNGDLVYTGSAFVTKYSSKIHCEDQAAPATDGLHRGSIVTVECIQRLWQRISGEETVIYLDKAPVPESVVVYDEQQNTLQSRVDGKIVTVADYLHATYVSYRPILQMAVVNYHLSTNEWGVKVGWTLELEEV